MSIDAIDLVWITVKDIKEAVKFYTDVVGLKLVEMNEEWGWAELQGNHGARLGIGQFIDKSPVRAGDNGIITFTVKNIDEARASMVKKGAHAMGDIEEVPGHVKMQMIQDPSGNRFQLVQKLS